MFRKDDWHRSRIIPGHKRRLIFECAVALAFARLAVWTLPFRTVRGCTVSRKRESRRKVASTIAPTSQSGTAGRSDARALEKHLSGSSPCRRCRVGAARYTGESCARSQEKHGAGRELLAAHAWLLSGTRCVYRRRKPRPVHAHCNVLGHRCPDWRGRDCSRPRGRLCPCAALPGPPAPRRRLPP